MFIISKKCYFCSERILRVLLISAKVKKSVQKVSQILTLFIYVFGLLEKFYFWWFCKTRTSSSWESISIIVILRYLMSQPDHLAPVSQYCFKVFWTFFLDTYVLELIFTSFEGTSLSLINKINLKRVNILWKHFSNTFASGFWVSKWKESWDWSQISTSFD